MQVFNKSERIYTVEGIDGKTYRLAPSSTCEVSKETAERLMELYPLEVIVIGNVQAEEIKPKEEEKEEVIAKPVAPKAKEKEEVIAKPVAPKAKAKRK